MLFSGLLVLGILFITLPLWLLQKQEGAGVVAASVGGALVAFGVGAFVQEFLDTPLQSVLLAFRASSDRADPASLISALSKEVESAVRGVVRQPFLSGPRADLQNRLKLSDAKVFVDVQAISLSQRYMLRQSLEEALRNHPQLRIRVALLHPYASSIRAREEDLNFPVGRMRSLIAESVESLEGLRKTLNQPDRLQVRGYFAIPYYGVIVADNQRALLSLSRERRGGDQNEGLYIEVANEQSGQMLADLKSGFDERWESSLNILEALQMSLDGGSVIFSAGRLTFRLLADRPVVVESVKVYSESSYAVEVRASVDSPDVIEVSADIKNPRILLQFRVEQALGTDGAWLRVPLDIPFSPPTGS